MGAQTTLKTIWDPSPDSIPTDQEHSSWQNLGILRGLGWCHCGVIALVVGQINFPGGGDIFCINRFFAESKLPAYMKTEYSKWVVKTPGAPVLGALLFHVAGSLSINPTSLLDSGSCPQKGSR